MLKAKGLHTFKNELSEVPSGHLDEARNVNIDRDGVIEPRRGFRQFGDTMPQTNDRAKQLLVYKGRILRHFDTTLQFDSDGAGTFTSFDGSYTEMQPNLRIKGVESNSNLYFTTTEGVRKISAKSSAGFTAAVDYITAAGGVKAVDIRGEITNVVGGYVPDGSSVGYKAVWAKTDANNNLILGSPSERFFLANNSGSEANITLNLTVPDGITTAHSFQIYRTALNPNLIDNLDEEMRLVYERVITSAEITAGEVIHIDTTPETFRVGGTNLYTNPISGEGTIQANEKPPLCQDLALYKGSVFYANTKTVHRRIFNLLTASTLLGHDLIIGNDSVFREYTFVNTAESFDTAAGGEVLISTSPSPSIAVDETARSLVRVINRDSNGAVYAYYISGPNDVPGQILLENRTLADTNFYLAVSNVAISASFSPELPVDAAPSTPFTSTIESDNEEIQNRLYFSKFRQPEAVPLTNFIDVGAKDKAIKRILALRDNLFVLKEDGVFRISGSVAPNFNVTLFDGSTQILAADTADTLNNQIYLLSSQGVATVSDTGIGVISRPIEDLITNVTTDSFDFETLSFGVGYETDRAYTIWLPTIPTDTVATQAYRFNVFTNTWTKWSRSDVCGVVNPFNDRMYLGAGNFHSVEEERKDRKTTDFADREFDVVISSIDSANLTAIITSINPLSTGDVLGQTQNLTIYQFNQLLRKLDLDVGPADNDYLSSLGASAGSNLTTLLNDFVTKLNADVNLTEVYVSSGTDTFVANQADFNAIVALLNTDGGVVYDNYAESTGTVTYETQLTAVSIEGVPTLKYVTPFVAGSAILYEGIDTEVIWNSNFGQDPSQLQQVREGTILFETNTFTDAIISYSSDLNPGYVSTSFENPGEGVWGEFNWGTQNWGGKGNSIPLRTLVPQQQQRCRYLNVRFEHITAREKFSILGISLVYRQLSIRAYK